MHSSYHCKYRYSKEKNREHRPHSLALFRFAHRFFIYNMVCFRRNHDSATELILDCVLEAFLIHIRQDIHLCIDHAFGFIQNLIRKEHIKFFTYHAVGNALCLFEALAVL